ncbi:MAG: hypothetical protein DBY43_05550 [Clostridiaceae bacterium]|nr:MAG: hypothetical protein DBY43_05550 [Clostridiaceae bacterium]
MLSKKIDRALRICSAVQEFRPEVEAEMCDGDDIWEEPYARHHLLWIACSEVSAVAGVRMETVFRQFVTGFGEDEDTMMDTILEFLEAEPNKRQNTRFVKTLYENLGKADTLDEFKQRLEAI